MKKFKSIFSKSIVLPSRMMNATGVKSVFLFAVLFFYSLCVFAQNPPNLNTRIVNLRYVPNWEFSPQCTQPAIVFDVQIMPGEGYDNHNMMGANLFIILENCGNITVFNPGANDPTNPFYPAGSIEGELLYPNPHDFYTATWIRSDLHGWMGKQALNLKLGRGFSGNLPMNEYVTAVENVCIPVDLISAPANNAYLYFDPLATMPNGLPSPNSSFWTSQLTGGTQQPITFCPERFYFYVDPYAKFDFGAMQTSYCIGDAPYPAFLPVTQIPDTNCTQPVNQNPLYCNNWNVDGTWTFNGTPTTTISTTQSGVYKFSPTLSILPAPTKEQAFCNLLDSVVVTIIDPNNLTTTNLSDCEGATFDLRDAVTLLNQDDDFANYTFYKKEGADYFEISHNHPDISETGGTYSVKYTAFSCSSAAYNDFEVEIKTKPAVGTLTAVVHPTECGTENGKIRFYVSGGSGAYGYAVYDGANLLKKESVYNNDSDGLIENLGVGTYYVKVWDINFDCDTAKSNYITLREDASNLFINVTAVDVNHCNDTNGTLYISVTGGEGNYEFFVIPDEYNVVDNKVEGLPVGEYEIIVKSGSCKASSGKVRINSIDDIEFFDMKVISKTPTQCDVANGTAQIAISGNMDYSYRLDYRPEVAATKTNDTINLKDLGAGEHSLRLFNHCGEKVFKFYIESTNSNAVSFSAETENVIQHCDGVTGGQIALKILSGVAPFEYSIDNSNWTEIPNDTILKNIAEGTYHIRIRDANDCYYEINDVTIGIEKASPVTIGSILAMENPTCGDNNGKIRFYVSGGSGVYKYSVNNAPDIYNYNNTTGGLITNLFAGNYHILVWDANHSCNEALSQDFVLDNNNTLISISVTPEDAEACDSNTGSLTVIVGGNITNYTLTLYDASGAPLPNTPNDDIFENLYPGVYSVKATDNDAPNCAAVSEEVRIGANPDASGLSIIALDTFPAMLCGINNGSVEFTIAGNTPYYYQLNSGNVVSASNPETVRINDLPTGEHYLRIFNDCGEITKKFTIENGNDNGLSFTVSTKNIKVDCSGNTSSSYIALAISGGLPSYWMTYDGGKNWKEITSHTDTIWDLAQGIYLVEIIDDEGCSYMVNEVEIKREQQCLLTLDVRVFLEGVIQPGTYMTTWLQGPAEYTFLPDKLLPMVNEYPGKTEFYYQINEPSGPAGAVVDWIWVEIWTNFEPYPIPFQNIYTYYEVLESRVLLLKPDGTIVDTNGRKPQFYSYTSDKVRIAVKHRNHLSVLSNLVSFDSNLKYDFSEAVDKAYKLPWATFGAQVWRNGAACLWAGDVNMNEAIDSGDNTLYFLGANENKSGSYSPEDVNMDGVIDARDGAFILENSKKALNSSQLFFIKKP